MTAFLCGPSWPEATLASLARKAVAQLTQMGAHRKPDTRPSLKEAKTGGEWSPCKPRIASYSPGCGFTKTLQVPGRPASHTACGIIHLAPLFPLWLLYSYYVSDYKTVRFGKCKKPLRENKPTVLLPCRDNPMGFCCITFWRFFPCASAAARRRSGMSQIGEPTAQAIL